MERELYSWCRELGQRLVMKFWDSVIWRVSSGSEFTSHTSALSAWLSCTQIIVLALVLSGILNLRFERNFWAVKSNVPFSTRISSTTSLLTLLQQWGVPCLFPSLENMALTKFFLPFTWFQAEEIIWAKAGKRETAVCIQRGFGIRRQEFKGHAS